MSNLAKPRQTFRHEDPRNALVAAAMRSKLIHCPYLQLVNFDCVYMSVVPDGRKLNDDLAGGVGSGSEVLCDRSIGAPALATMSKFGKIVALRLGKP